MDCRPAFEHVQAGTPGWSFCAVPDFAAGALKRRTPGTAAVARQVAPTATAATASGTSAPRPRWRAGPGRSRAASRRGRAASRTTSREPVRARARRTGPRCPRPGRGSRGPPVRCRTRRWSARPARPPREGPVGARRWRVPGWRPGPGGVGGRGRPAVSRAAGRSHRSGAARSRRSCPHLPYGEGRAQGHQHGCRAVPGRVGDQAGPVPVAAADLAPALLEVAEHRSVRDRHVPDLDGGQ